ncbi:MAG: hypothetical protein P4M11_11730 [Candidatus Pacebacteria bacterium]|nr:hypothetical protein [Candidatus Paceibacterota bacterium]
METQETFESSVCWWSLEFRSGDFEESYRDERRSLKRVPKQIKLFFIIVVASAATLMVIDILSSMFVGRDYSYGVLDYIIAGMYIPVLLIEYALYHIKCLSFLRGSVITVAIYFILFFNSMTSYSKKFDYPVFSPA